MTLVANMAKAKIFQNKISKSTFQIKAFVELCNIHVSDALGSPTKKRRKKVYDRTYTFDYNALHVFLSLIKHLQVR